jgi:hypothetical protein
VQVLREGVLSANRLADAVGADRPFIHAARDPIKVGSGLTEVPLKEEQGLGTQIETSRQRTALK